MLDIQQLRDLCTDDTLLLTQHVVKRCQERGISYDSLKNAIMTGEIIEQYPNDTPYPSCLILGGGPLHIVAGIGQGMLWIITAYKPNPQKWENDWKTRKAGEQQ